MASLKHDFPDKLTHKTTITRKLREQILQELASYALPRYLEIGCSRGYTILSLEDGFTFGCGVDVHVPSLQEAKSFRDQNLTNPKKVDLVLGTVNDFPVGRWDVVLIDASHEFNDVRDDLAGVLMRTSCENMSVFFHDYGLTTAGVRKFIDTVFSPGDVIFVGEEKDYNPLGMPVDGPEAVLVRFNRDLKVKTAMQVASLYMIH